MAPQQRTPKKGNAGFVVGSARFKKISAVEGIKYTSEMKGRTALSKRRDNITAEERRETIIRAYRKT
jgi:hypothetical protein